MLNIWENNFYFKPPALSWLYEGNFNDFCDYTDSDFSGLVTSDYNPLNNAIVSISIPDRETQMESIYYGGMEFPQYTRGNNAGTVTIKFNEDNNYTITKILEAIYNKFSYNANGYPNAKGNDDIKYRESNSNTIKDAKTNRIEIRVFKYKGIKNSDNPDESDYCYSIFFENCKLVKLDGFELNYESEDTITRTATFSFVSMQIVD